MRNHNLHSIILWTTAIIVLFGVAIYIGWQVFYGMVVPYTANISGLPTWGVFTFAALAGLMVNLGPCSLAVLPAYMSFYLGTNTDSQERTFYKSVRMGLIASLGVIGFYLVLGLMFGIVGTSLASYMSQLKLIIAGLIFLLGIHLLRGNSLELKMISQFQDSVSQVSKGRTPFLRLIGFGVVYGAGGVSCFLPIFLPLVFFPFLSGELVESSISFALFALFQALFLIGATVLIGVGKQHLLQKLNGHTALIKRVGGVILIAVSIYMFLIFTLLGM